MRLGHSSEQIINIMSILTICDRLLMIMTLHQIPTESEWHASHASHEIQTFHKISISPNRNHCWHTQSLCPFPPNEWLRSTAACTHQWVREDGEMCQHLLIIFHQKQSSSFSCGTHNEPKCLDDLRKRPIKPPQKKWAWTERKGCLLHL